MTRQLDMSSRGLFSTVAEDRLDGSTQTWRSSGGDMPPTLADELDGIAKRVRTRLKNMSAHIIEIGRELRPVKRCLGNDRFLNWITTARELAPRHAQLTIRAAEWAEGREEIVSDLEPTAIYLFASPSTPKIVRVEVLFRLEKGERPAHGFIKGMIRAVKGDPYGALPDSKEEEIEGFLKYCGYAAVPDHLKQFVETPTNRTRRSGLVCPLDDWTTTPVAAGASSSATDAGSGEIANVL